MKVSFSLVFFCSGILVFACSPELKTSVPDGDASSKLIETARKWHARHRDANARDTILPDWDKAWTLGTANGDRVLVAPAPSKPSMNERLSFSRFFIFQIEYGHISQGRIVEFLGNDYHVEKNTERKSTRLN